MIVTRFGAPSQKHYVHLWYQNFIQSSIKSFGEENKDSKVAVATL